MLDGQMFYERKSLDQLSHRTALALNIYNDESE